MTALLLGALGLLLSLVAPGVLVVRGWPDRAPAAAVVLWQAITLAAVLSALGVVLAAPEELVRAAGSGRPVALAALVAALAVAAMIVHPAAGVARPGDVPVARPPGTSSDPGRPAGPAPRSADRRRCGPGARRGGAAGLLRARSRAPGGAQRGSAPGARPSGRWTRCSRTSSAHLRHRHELVMESFTAFYRAVPRPLRRRAPLDAVHLLLEMVADDAARKRCGAGPLRTALEQLTDAPAPDGLTPPAGAPPVRNAGRRGIGCRGIGRRGIGHYGRPRPPIGPAGSVAHPVRRRGGGRPDRIGRDPGVTHSDPRCALAGPSRPRVAFVGNCRSLRVSCYKQVVLGPATFIRGDHREYGGPGSAAPHLPKPGDLPGHRLIVQTNRGPRNAGVKPRNHVAGRASRPNPSANPVGGPREERITAQRETD